MSKANVPISFLKPKGIPDQLTQFLNDVIEGKAQLEGEEVTENETVSTKKPFEILEDADPFKTRIQINSNDIKHMMIMMDSELIGNRHLIPDDMVGKERERAEAASRFEVLGLIQDGKASNWIDRNHDKEWNKFVKAIKAFDIKLQNIFSEVKQSDKIRFALLPYFIKEADQIAILSNETWIGMRVTSSRIRASWMGVYFEIKGRIIHHDGKSFKEAEITHTVGAFEGEKVFPEIGIKIPSQDKKVYDMLVERGKKYERIHANGPSYLMSTGNIIRRSWWFDHEFPAVGRVMVDRIGMANIDPNYEKYFGVNRYRDDDDGNINTITFNDDIYFMTSPYCYGFSFVAKQWGEIHIDQLEEIKFRTESYDKLVLNTETKDILFSLVENSEQGKDLVDGKGGGVIFLLHGTPGVGKTLTAETIAETLQRPLYMVSVGELGTDVSSLEENLRNILQVSASWNAVLLIDEVDIFLEKRDLDVHRNALVGVFLRLLEYYNGILFLTTNRVEQIDPAFYSRISLAIKYPALSVDARISIWKGQMALYSIEMNDEDLLFLSNKFEFNGRQIKNCVRIVNSLASRKKVKPSLEDFLIVVNKVEEFNQTLKD